MQRQNCQAVLRPLRAGLARQEGTAARLPTSPTRLSLRQSIPGEQLVHIEPSELQAKLREQGRDVL